MVFLRVIPLVERTSIRNVTSFAHAQAETLYSRSAEKEDVCRPALSQSDVLAFTNSRILLSSCDCGLCPESYFEPPRKSFTSKRDQTSLTIMGLKARKAIYRRFEVASADFKNMARQLQRFTAKSSCVNSQQICAIESWRGTVSHKEIVAMDQSVSSDTGGMVEFLPHERTAFGSGFAHFRHRINQSNLFSDEQLADLIDRYPREYYMITTMTRIGDKPVWRSGDLGEASGKTVVEAIRNGRLWLCLRRLDLIAPEIAQQVDASFAHLEQENTSLNTSHHASSLLISSPGARVLYHADIPMVALWHIRGSKRVWLYDADNKDHLPDQVLERVILRETEEEVPYDQNWDSQATVIDLQPGWALSWQQNAPHRVDNLDGLNVSITTDFFTPEAQKKYGVYFANGMLRKHLGFAPRSTKASGLGALIKCALALVIKKAGLGRGSEREMIMTFKLDPDNPGKIIDLPKSEQKPITQT